jgi:predicted CoA-binding protein
MTGPRALNDRAVISRVLTTPATWAVVGLSTDTSRTAYAVARWMKDRLGHRIVPIHPRATAVWGEPGYRRLADIPDGTTVDVVDCFVSSGKVGKVVDQAVDQRERLGITTVWLQLGVVDHAAAGRALGAGLDVVMDTCPKIEYPRL